LPKVTIPAELGLHIAFDHSLLRFYWTDRMTTRNLWQAVLGFQLRSCGRSASCAGTPAFTSST